MSLAERLKSGPSRPPVRKTLDVWLSQLPEDERECAIAMLRDPSWSAPALLEAFMAEGMPKLSKTRIQDERKRF